MTRASEAARRRDGTYRLGGAFGRQRSWRVALQGHAGGGWTTGSLGVDHMTKNQSGYGCALALIWIGVFLLSIAFACAWRGLYRCVIKTEIPSTIRLGPGDAGTCYVSHEKGDRWPIPCKIRVTCLRADTNAPVDVRDEYSAESCSFFVQPAAEYKVEFFPSGRESSNAALAKLTWVPVGVYEWRSFVLGAIVAVTGVIVGLVTFVRSRIASSRHAKDGKAQRPPAS